MEIPKLFVTVITGSKLSDSGFLISGLFCIFTSPIFDKQPY